MSLQAIFNPIIGAGIGALSAVLIRDAQIWRSPQGGIIACLFASRVAASSLHINMGFTLTIAATVPDNYTLVGKVVPSLCSWHILLSGCTVLGLLIGVLTCKSAQEEKPL